MDNLVSYKAEIAISLQRLIESYNLIVLDQFQAFYQNEHEKEVHLNERERILNLKEKEILRTKEILYGKQEQVKQCMIGKDKEIKELFDSLQLQ